MTGFTIRKAFDFCYGHRVWSQELDLECSLESPCSCRHLHGHQGRAWVELTSQSIDKRGMVTDFNNLKWLKSWVDSVIDHKMLLDVNDPLLPQLVGIQNMGASEFLTFSWQKHSIGEDTCYWQYAGKEEKESSETMWEKVRQAKLAHKEMLEGITVVPFVPTSENLAKFMWFVVKHKMSVFLRALKEHGHSVSVSSVTWEETPKSSSTYSI